MGDSLFLQELVIQLSQNNELNCWFFKLISDGENAKLLKLMSVKYSLIHFGRN